MFKVLPFMALLRRKERVNESRKLNFFLFCLLLLLRLHFDDRFLLPEKESGLYIVLSVIYLIIFCY